MKIQTKKLGGLGSGGGGRWERGVGLVGGGGQGGCERRIKVFVKIQKKKFFFWGGGAGVGSVELVGESGWM